MPEISLPDIKLPDVRFRDARLPDMKLPDIDLRDHLPDMDLSKLSMPGVLKDFALPDDVSMPKVQMPSVDLRGMRAPHVEMPAVDLRSLDPRRLRELAPFAKPAPKQASPLPWVVVAAAAGMFAGWYLATSPVAAPMVRGIAARIRARLEAWRSARAEWEDAEERTEGFWAGEQGWRTEGAQGGEAPAAEPDDELPSDESAGWEAAVSMAAIGGTESAQSADSSGGTGFDDAEIRSARDTEREG